MKRYFIIFLFVTYVLPVCSGLPNPDSLINKEVEDKLTPVNSIPNLYKWTDLINVYVLRDGDKALLINLGDGSILPHLSDIGVTQIEWVLFTGHHREQCQGYPLLAGWNPKIAAPKGEKALFEQPTSFRKSKRLLGDAYSVHGASYVRPPVQPIPIDLDFSRMDTFKWHGYEFWCLETPGTSPGSMSYLLKINGRWIAFSGNVMLEGGKMYNFFDSEWDYGYGAGIRALHNSAALLRDFDPFVLLPVYGDIILKPETQLTSYMDKLFNLERLLLRGYDASTYASASQDIVSKPTAIPHLWQVSPHLFKFKGPEYFPNFSLILSDNGHALVVDCGLVDTTFLASSLEAMKVQYGLKKIDALIITHVHGDHFLQAPYLKRNWGTSLWALENMVPMMEHPERHNLAALITGYDAGFDSIHVDRVFKSGETFNWEGYQFTVDWMPGQTEYALCMHGIIDEKVVAFTGDNIFGDPRNSKHTGHEALVARNSSILEEGYIYAAEYLTRLNPDILVGGHSFIMDKPAELIGRYREWSYEMRNALQEVSNIDDYHYWFDPYWVHTEPYGAIVRNGETVEINIVVKNFSDNEKTYRIDINAPSGIVANPTHLEFNIDGNKREILPVKLTASAYVPAGISIITFDVTLDGKRIGGWFDTFLDVRK